jgi:hypothetical protein
VEKTDLSQQRYNSTLWFPWIKRGKNQPLLEWVQQRLEAVIPGHVDKYGPLALVLVHPSMLVEGEPVLPEGAVIKATNAMLPDHIWLGSIKDKQS